MGLGGCEMGVRLRNFRLALCVHLQTAITSSFQLQFDHRLKRSTPDFPSFETRYSMHNLSSRKCSKMCPTVVKWRCDISAHGLCRHLQTAITSSFQLQIEHRLKLWTPHFPRFETTYGFEDFAAISQLRNEGMRLRNGTRVLRGGFVVAKIFAEGGMELRNHFAAKWRFCSDFLGLRNNFAAKWRFRRGLFLAAKFCRPLNFHAFELLLIPNFLLSLLLTFLLILIIQKPILHQNKLELKH
uniref:Uncharacterized protein n=1 Tax=Vitis vinifera TaxID=29760 RepID=A5B1R8_VITVI|nr:hypothetical protein VITISV_042885 [Vitis vinifera]